MSSTVTYRRLAKIENAAVDEYLDAVASQADPATVNRLLDSALRVSALRHRLSRRLLDEALSSDQSRATS